MTQDERWLKRYEEVKTFIEENKRRPSKYALEKRNQSWLICNGVEENYNKNRLKWWNVGEEFVFLPSIKRFSYGMVIVDS